MEEGGGFDPIDPRNNEMDTYTYGGMIILLKIMILGSLERVNRKLVFAQL